jgi:sporulation protein YlmC with PRC-barrel domain
MQAMPGGHAPHPSSSNAKEFLMDTLNDTLSHDVISSDRVEGTTVYNDAGDKLGSIDYLVIDKRSGKVRYAALEFGGFLGMGTNRYPVPWSLLEYSNGRGGYVVPLDKDTLDGAPRYEENRRPDYDDEYGRTVYDYYGVGW